jgi:hypothetical protein
MWSIEVCWIHDFVEQGNDTSIRSLTEGAGRLCHGYERRLGRGQGPATAFCHCCRFGSEDPRRRSGDQVALKVEIVVNDGVHAEKCWADPADLKRCILRSRRRTI